MSKKSCVTASIIAISQNAAVNYLRYQYCLVRNSNYSTLMYDVGTELLKSSSIDRAVSLVPRLSSGVEQYALNAGFIKWMVGRKQQKQSTSKCAISTLTDIVK